MLLPAANRWRRFRRQDVTQELYRLLQRVINREVRLLALDAERAIVADAASIDWAVATGTTSGTTIMAPSNE